MRSLYERLVSLLARSEPERREVIVATGFLVLLHAIGSAGYAFLEGWNWQDGVYMTFITLTTIGFNELHTLSTAGRMFTMMIAVTGIGIVAFIGTRSAQLLLVNQRVRERHLQRMIDRTSNHFVICGYGRVGRRIAYDLGEADRAFVVIDRDEDVAEDLKEAHLMYVHGDAEDEEVLVQAGVERAEGVILTLPEDSANVFVALAVRELNRDAFILARANTLRNRPKLLHAGADKVLSPDEIGADRMSQVILRPNVDRFMEQVLHTGALGLQMEEVRVEAGAHLAGRSLAESNFRQRFDAIVVAIIEDASDEMRFNPSADTRLGPGDVLIVLGSKDMIRRLRVEGCNAE